MPCVVQYILVAYFTHHSLCLICPKSSFLLLKFSVFLCPQGPALPLPPVLHSWNFPLFSHSHRPAFYKLPALPLQNYCLKMINCKQEGLNSLARYSQLNFTVLSCLSSPVYIIYLIKTRNSLKDSFKEWKLLVQGHPASGGATSQAWGYFQGSYQTSQAQLLAAQALQCTKRAGAQEKSGRWTGAETKTESWLQYLPLCDLSQGPLEPQCLCLWNGARSIIPAPWIGRYSWGLNKTVTINLLEQCLWQNKHSKHVKYDY